MWKKRKDDVRNNASNRVLDLEEGLVEGQDALGGWAYPWGQNSMS